MSRAKSVSKKNVTFKEVSSVGNSTPVQMFTRIDLPFFEEQKALLCGMHAINNLLGANNKAVVNKEGIDNFCQLKYPDVDERVKNCDHDNGYYSNDVLMAFLRDSKPSAPYSATEIGGGSVNAFLTYLPVFPPTIEASFGFLHLVNKHWTTYRILKKNNKSYLVHIDSLNRLGQYPAYEISSEGMEKIRDDLLNTTEAIIWVYPRNQEAEFLQSDFYLAVIQ
jgi:hypothetical protein